MYFGWGGEDDDLYARVVYHNYSVMRYPEEIARYRMISHKKDPKVIRSILNGMSFPILILKNSFL
ncbi:uncharacterized protein DC041_0007778 [Schistosoma bovis]|uniref:Galactosyltransferase C-terminal domain-containing protein n=1 Tax=Schistosoma bovis TaxID=6184 RepID=A0A430PX38_SCHBO|nr:uncharacterized protein DC041_0007778 [Schistosoma bovis]